MGHHRFHIGIDVIILTEEIVFVVGLSVKSVVRPQKMDKINFIKMLAVGEDTDFTVNGNEVIVIYDNHVAVFVFDKEGGLKFTFMRARYGAAI